MEFRSRDYQSEYESCSMTREPAHTHPLDPEPSSKPRVSHSLASELLIDSDSAGSSLEYDTAPCRYGSFVDPLSELAHKPSSVDKVQMSDSHKLTIPGSLDDSIENDFKEWDIYKKLVMHKYSCSAMITVSAVSDIFSGSSKGRIKLPSITHLEELDFDGKACDEEMKTVSEQEYIMRLHELNDEITQAWQKNDRITALKFSVKAAKLLTDTSVPQFYPTLFILVTDIMDTLGHLVWKRIKRKAETDDKGKFIQDFPEHFTCIDVPPDAKDTCKNWFYKIGSVRELLPRIYLETALLRCWYFLSESPLNACVRLSSMIRGLGDPLASAYAQLYLAHCANSLMPSETGYLIAGLDDFMCLVHGIHSGTLSSRVFKSSSDRKNFFKLVEPVIEWIVKCLFQHADKEKAVKLLREFGVQENEWKPHRFQPISLLVHHILKQISSDAVNCHVLGLLKLVECSTDLSMAQSLNYRLLGMKLSECSLSKEVCFTILNYVMEDITQYSELNEYLMVVDVYIDLILQNSMDDQLTVMLDDIFEHVHGITLNDMELTHLESILIKLVCHFRVLSHVLALDHFMDILDALAGSSRVSVYKQILCQVCRSNQNINDPVMKQFLFDACKILHDSIDSSRILSYDSREISHLVERFVQLVDFKCDYDEHLSFLVECRAIFFSFDSVKETLAHSANCLAATRLKLGKASQKSFITDFVKGCVAFNQVNIPSIKSIAVQFNLFLETAEISLQGSFLSHTEDLILAAIKCLEESQNNGNAMIEEGILMGIQKLASFLIVTPGHPSLGGLYLLKDFLKWLHSQTGLVPAVSIQLYCAIIYTSSALSQQRLPYHVGNKEVVSNDELYFGDVSYQEELKSISNEMVKQIMECLVEAPASDKRGNLALDACNCFLISFMPTGEVIDHCTRLIEIACSSYTNAKYLQTTKDSLVRISHH